MEKRIDIYANTDVNYRHTLGLVSLSCGRNRTNIAVDTLGEAVAEAKRIYGDVPVYFEGLPAKESQFGHVIGGEHVRAISREPGEIL